MPANVPAAAVGGTSRAWRLPGRHGPAGSVVAEIFGGIRVILATEGSYVAIAVKNHSHVTCWANGASRCTCARVRLHRSFRIQSAFPTIASIHFAGQVVAEPRRGTRCHFLPLTLAMHGLFTSTYMPQSISSPWARAGRQGCLSALRTSGLRLYNRRLCEPCLLYTSPSPRDS